LKRLKIALILVLLLVTIEFQSFCQVKGEIGDVNFTVRMTVTYSNKGTKIWNFTEDEQSVSLFMNNTWQNVQLLNHSYSPKSIKNDTDGNPTAVLQFPKSQLTSGKSLNYTVTYSVLSRPRILPSISGEESRSLNEIPNELKEKYTKAEGPWLTNETELQDLAHSIAGNETNVLTIVKNLAAWIADLSNIRYETHEVPLYPNETLKRKEGDCDDKAILLITLCRICGIPSYLQVGCIYDPTSPLLNDTYWQGHVTVVSKRISWHGWAIVYIPPWGWLPVDLTYVLGGTSDPLSRIRQSAVTSQWVIQYMNFTKSDYVASSRSTRDFLQQNGFYIYEEDEMRLNQPSGIPWQQILETLKWFSIVAMVGGAVAIVFVAVVVYVRKTEKKNWTKLVSRQRTSYVICGTDVIRLVI
jgi:transglutaminase-like putative cysteine protease